MREGQIVKFRYVGKYEATEEVTLFLSGIYLEDVSDAEIKKRLGAEYQDCSLEFLVEEGIILAVRHLLMLCMDAKDIIVTAELTGTRRGYLDIKGNTYVGQQLNVRYMSKNGVYQETISTLSRVYDEKLTDEEVVERLSKKYQLSSLEFLQKTGILFVARNLLLLHPEATAIEIVEAQKQKKDTDVQKDSGLAGGIIILAIVAIIVAIIAFPLLVMLGMRGKFFFKRFYNEFQGEKYKEFVKKYSIVGAGLYAVFIIMILVDKIFKLYMLVGPAFAVMFFGGVAYFVVSLVLTKKQFIDGQMSISFVDLIKNRIKNETLGLVMEEERCPEETIPEETIPEETIPEETIQEEETQNDNLCDLETLACKIEKDAMVDVMEEISVKEEVTESDNKEKGNKEDDKKEKNTKKLLVVLIIIIALLVLLIGGFVCWMIFGKANSNQGGNTTSQSTSSDYDSETHETGKNTETQSAEIDIDDYVGYWLMEDYYQKELTIHSGYGNELYFSLWYYPGEIISYVQAELQGNVATFSLAMEGGAIKGTLTFVDSAIILNITDSGRYGMPVETMEYTVCRMSSVTDWDVIPGTTEDDYFQEGDLDVTNDFVLPYSSDMLLTYEDLYHLTEEELRLARNEIYARHGRKFNNQELQDYFNSKDWYFGYIESEDFSEDLLSDIERQNVDFIMSFEP